LKELINLDVPPARTSSETTLAASDDSRQPPIL